MFQKLVLGQRSFTFADFCCPRGATLLHFAAGAGAKFREASFGATLLHFCSLLLPAPLPLGLMPVLLALMVLNSEMPVLEQRAFIFAHFCCPRSLFFEDFDPLEATTASHRVLKNRRSSIFEDFDPPEATTLGHRGSLRHKSTHIRRTSTQIRHNSTQIRHKSIQIRHKSTQI